MDSALAAARAVHFTAILLLEGSIFFRFVIAGPPLRAAYKVTQDFGDGLRSSLSWMTWLALVVGLVSGAAWLFVLAGQIVGLPPIQALSQGTDWTLLTQTEFGETWLLRTLAIGLLAISLGGINHLRLVRPWAGAIVIILAMFLTGSLAWSGHGASTSGAIGDLHLVADVFHLVASGIWLGGLIPLAAMLLLAQRAGETTWLETAAAVTRKFSLWAMASVLVLLLSGIVNTYVLVGSTSALVGTSYGQLLLAKISLFFLMLCFAAVNRLRLTPRLAGEPEYPHRSIFHLARNSAIEFALGLAVLGIVGMLGTMPPASHSHHHHGSFTPTNVPADAAFIHIHSEEGMAEVTIMPGRPGTSDASIRLLADDLSPLAARAVTITLKSPVVGSKPTTRITSQEADGLWSVKKIALTQPGIWTVVVSVEPDHGHRLVLDGPIVIRP
jgi:putative copper resistance protein D